MNANQALKLLLSQLLKHGADVPSRVGETKELTFQSFTVDNIQDRYITVPGRKVSVPHQIAETMWVLAGRNDTDWLSAYLPQAPSFADDGKHWRAGYGPRLRAWSGGFVEDAGSDDQLKNVIELLRKDPTTRRAVISLWDPASDLTTETLDVPCNNWLHFLARDGKLNLNIAIRSNDVMWGWSGINFFEWSVLLEIVAKHTGLKVGSLHFNVSSLHLYERHFEKAKRIVESPIESQGAPGDRVSYGSNLEQGMIYPKIDEQIAQWFRIEGQIRAGNLSHIETMKDPLLWSWLWAIAYYWGYEETAEHLLSGLDIMPALALSPKRKVPVDLCSLIERMIKLHTEKSAAYGNSWKKRGELFSIIPNIARKVDRILAQTETSDETKLDTAIDTVVYLAKYSCWVEENKRYQATLKHENERIAYVVKKYGNDKSYPNVVSEESFEELLVSVKAGDQHGRREALTQLVAQAVGYLVKLWSGPEGRSLRNEKRSWNPESAIQQEVSYNPVGLVAMRVDKAIRDVTRNA